MEIKKIRPAIKEKIPYEDHLEILKFKRPHLKYGDWFINQPYIPESDDEEYQKFWDTQEDLCKYGFFMEGYYIHGFLYWHLNFWKTEVTKLNEYGETFETYENPTFRDNEWIISDGISRAKYYQKGLAIGGSRRLGKSVFISSYISYGASLFSDTQNLFVGMSGDDIAVTTGKIGKGLNDIPDYFQWMRVKEDWEKQVSLGIKDTKGKKTVFSEIFIRNLEAGGKKKQESIAGTKPSILVLEEALWEDELIYGDHMPCAIKYIEVGDYITGADGELTKVLEKIDVGVKPLFKFILENGNTITSCDDHIWPCIGEFDSFYSELTTKEIRQSGRNFFLQVKDKSFNSSWVKIVGIEYFGEGQAYCLKVDNKDHLFLTTHRLVTHNCGKSPWLKGFKAAVPGFTSPEGWICSPIAIFTGGDMDNYHDAKNVMMNPFSHNFLEYECTENKRDRHGNLRKHGLFLGNKYRYDAKDLTTLGDYLRIEDPESDFYNIPFYVSNEEKALEILEDELERLLTNPDKSLYDKHRMYYPITVDDIFLNVGTNMYNTKACQKQQQAIEDADITGIPVELYSDGNKICWRDSNKEYIKEFPVDRQSKDAPIMIYEFPESGAPKFLYTFGVDSYTQDESGTSDSLGTVYIYKRMHSLTGEGLRDAFVASYAARPDTQAEWDENARMLIMFYNAYGLVENDQPGFCKYMVSKGNAELYLSPTPSFYKTLVVNGSAGSRPFGVSRSSKAVREYLNVLLKKYMEETIHTVYDESGQTIISEVKGITRILDYTLLSELIGFGPGVNVDRQVAASLALACALELDPMLGTKIGEDSKNGQQTIDKAFKNIKKQTFKSSGSSLSGSRKLFKR